MNQEYFDLCESDNWEKELDNDPFYAQWSEELRRQSEEEQNEPE